MRFRKKHGVIEAHQYDGDWQEAIDWCMRVSSGSHDGKSTGLMVDNGKLSVQTLEGVMKVGYLDWIICGVNGEFYPCKPDIFDKTYEPVTPEHKAEPKNRPATLKQKAFMDQLEIEYESDVTLEEASEMISEELEARKSDDWLDAIGSDPEWYKS